MQQLKRFQAPTAEEAYDLVREEFGPEAVIVSTRSVKAPGLFGSAPREYVEVVARYTKPELEQSFPRTERAADGRAKTPKAKPAGERGRRSSRKRKAEEPQEELAPPFVNELAGLGAVPPGLVPPDVMERIERSVSEGIEAEPAAASGPFAALNAGPAAPPVDAKLIETIAEQVAEVRALLSRMAIAEADERIDGGPSVLQAARARLREQDVAEGLIVTVLDALAQGLPRQADMTTLMRALERKLAAQLAPAAHIDLSRKPVAIFLVGPAGGGKTTMALRLALEIRRVHGLSVALAGCDVNRAGAPQQLAAMAAAAGVPSRLCYAPGELQAMLAEPAADVMLVDMPGHNGARRDRMAELNAFLQAAPRNGARRTVLLTVPATMKRDDMTATIAAYRAAGVDALAFTRCDETAVFGSACSAAAEAQLGIAYTAHGDAITDPPRVGDNLALARAVVHAGWAVESTRLRARTAARAV